MCNNYGGKRSNAGRPLTPSNLKAKRKHITLADEESYLIKIIGDGSLTAGIKTLLNDWKAKHKK